MIDRSELKNTLTLILSKSIDDISMIPYLYSACAIAFVYPDKFTSQQREILRQAYVQLVNTGSL